MSFADQRHCFPFVAAPDALVLILGSIPGQRSLMARQYYAHPQNIFWDIMGDLFDAGRDLKYEKRLKVLKKNGIALWDVVFKCRRPGSMDSDIETKTVVANNFKDFFGMYSKIRAILFNGHKAEELFAKLVFESLPADIQRLKFARLPSTSPAYASLTKDEKKTCWQNHLQPILSRRSSNQRRLINNPKNPSGAKSIPKTGSPCATQ